MGLRPQWDYLDPTGQQKLVGPGAIGRAGQGHSVAIAADGNTAIVGGLRQPGHRGGVGPLSQCLGSNFGTIRWTRILTDVLRSASKWGRGARAFTGRRRVRSVVGRRLKASTKSRLSALQGAETGHRNSIALSPAERHDLAGLWRNAVSGPCFHELAPLLKKVAAPVSPFYLVGDRMSQGSLTYFTRKIRAFSRPIAKRGNGSRAPSRPLSARRALPAKGFAPPDTCRDVGRSGKQSLRDGVCALP